MLTSSIGLLGRHIEDQDDLAGDSGFGGPEIIRGVRQSQIEIGGAPLTYLAGDVPILDAADLAGLNPTVEWDRSGRSRSRSCWCTSWAW